VTLSMTLHKMLFMQSVANNSISTSVVMLNVVAPFFGPKIDYVVIKRYKTLFHPH
jgi:hypothetical protein